MAGCGNHLDRSASQIDLLAIVNIRRDLPWPSGIGLRVEISGKGSADLVRSDFRLGILPRALGILAREIHIHSVHGVEFPGAADVIVMRVRVKDDDRKLRKL